ncbi:MAG: DNA polymerase III subunit beta [Nitrospirota bacterium]
MQITMKREALLRALQRVQGVVERRNTMPILSHALIDAKGAGVTVFATDLEIGLKGQYEATVEEPGQLAVAARKLYEIVRELPSEEVRLLSADQKSVRLEAGKSRFQIMTLPPEEFPSLPVSDAAVELAVDGAAMGELIRKTVFAVGENDARYVLNGTLLTTVAAGGKTALRLVGTDGHRLAMADRPVSAGGGAAKAKGAAEVNAIIPKKALLEIRRLLDEKPEGPLTISLSKSQCTLQLGGLTLAARLMEGTYPNYHQVIPKSAAKRMTVNKMALEGALRRVSLLAREKTNAVKWELGAGRLQLTASNPDLGEAQEELAVSYAGEGVTTGFNARYLLDALSVADTEEVSMELKDALSPCVIRENGVENFLCVIMPMRI